MGWWVGFRTECIIQMLSPKKNAYQISSSTAQIEGSIRKNADPDVMTIYTYLLGHQYSSPKFNANIPCKK